MVNTGLGKKVIAKLIDKNKEMDKPMLVNRFIVVLFNAYFYIYLNCQVRNMLFQIAFVSKKE